MTNELMAAAEAAWTAIMRSPLPRTEEDEMAENAQLARLSRILGV
jgi:hypothetical protein